MNVQNKGAGAAVNDEPVRKKSSEAGKGCARVCFGWALGRSWAVELLLCGEVRTSPEGWALLWVQWGASQRAEEVLFWADW